MSEQQTMSGEILEIAGEISHAAQSESGVLAKLCAAAESEVEGRLREDISKQDCAGAFTCACAWLAAAALLSARTEGEEFSSLRAGDLSVTAWSQRERGEYAARLKRQAWELMAPYCTDSNFFFRGVQG